MYPCAPLPRKNSIATDVRSTEIRELTVGSLPQRNVRLGVPAFAMLWSPYAKTQTQAQTR